MSIKVQEYACKKLQRQTNAQVQHYNSTGVQEFKIIVKYCSIEEDREQQTRMDSRLAIISFLTMEY